MIFSRNAQSLTNAANETAGRKPFSALFSLAVMMLFIAVRLWRLSASCLWFDEIFSVHAAHHSWPDLLQFVAADIIHPPLFYMLLKIWIAVGGESLLWLRLFPALISFATIVPFFLLCRELHLKQNERILAILLLAVNGYLIKYAQELRMYSLLMFLSVCSLWLFIRFFRAEPGTRGRFVGLFLINFLLVYSHYSGWIMVVVECLVLLIWQRRKAKFFLVALTLMLLAYIPWVFLVIRNAEVGKGLAQNIGWMTRPTFWDITQLYALLNKPFWSIQSTASRPYDLLTAFFALLILGVPLVMLCIRLWRGTDLTGHFDSRTLRMLLVFVLVPVAIVFSLSWLLPQSVWGTRHLIIVIAPYAILVAVAVMRFPLNWIRITVCLMLGLWFLMAAGTFALTPPQVYIWCAWEPLARQVSLNETRQDHEVRVYAFEDLVAYHLWFAFDSASRRQFKVSVVKGIEEIPEDPAYFLPRRFNGITRVNATQVTEDEIWIAYRAANWDETKPPLNTLKDLGYATGNVLSTQAQGQQAYMVQMVRK